MAYHFKVGEQCVCIRENTLSEMLIFQQVCPRWPLLNEVFTIRAVFLCPVNYKQGLRFKEIICPINPHHGIEYGFNADDFAPLVKTDISVFTAMLKRKPVKVDA